MQVGELLVRLGLDSSDFERALADARQGIQNTFSAMKEAGKNITSIGAGMALGLGVAVKSAMDFEAQMSKVAALSGATGSQLDALREKAIELGSSTSFSASEAAQGMEMLAASGMNTNQIMDAMPGVLAAAAASGEEMSLVAETMGSALNGFGLQASQATHVADVLAQAANMSAIGVEDMAYGFKYAAPVAASLGISLEEVSAAMVEMGNAGIKGEQAGTIIRSSLLSLIDPPKEAAAALSNLGINAIDANGKMLPLGNIIGQLQTKMAGMTEAQKAQTLATIFGQEAVSGMMVLIDGGKQKFDEYTQSLINSNGAAAETATVMQDNLKGSIDQLQGALESAAITIGEALTPTIRAIADNISGIIEWFNNLSPSVQNSIATFGLFATALALVGGPLLLLIGYIPNIVAGFGTMGTGIIKLADIFKGGSSTIASAIKDTVITGLNVLKSTGKVAFDIFKMAGQDAFNFIKTAGPTAFNLLKTAATTTFTVMRTAATSFFTFMMANPLVAVITLIVGAIVGLALAWKNNWFDIQGKTQAAWNAIKSAFESGKAKVIEVINNLKTSITTFFSNAGTWLLQAGKDIIQGLVNGIGSMLETAKQKAIEVASNVKEAIVTFFKIGSPSKVMEDIGYWVAKGLAMGLGKDGEVVTQAELLASKVLEIEDRIHQLNKEYTIAKILTGENSEESKKLREEIAKLTQDYEKLASAAAKASAAQAAAHGRSGDAAIDAIQKAWDAGKDIIIDGSKVSIGGGGGSHDFGKSSSNRNSYDPELKKRGLASGGVITKPTLAWIGETARARPEIVTPEHLMEDVFRRVLDSSQGKQITVYNTFNSPEPLTPSVIQRKQEQLMRRLALEF